MKDSVGIKKNVIYNIIKTCSSIIFPLISFPYVSRVLLPKNMGKIDFSNSIVSYFLLIASLGITTYAVRECAARKNDKKSLEKKASEIFSINIITTAISYILLFISLLVFNKLHSYAELILIQSLVILMTTIGADWINVAMEDFRYITWRTFIIQILSILLMFILVKSREDYYIYALITVLAASGANILNIFYRKKYCKISFTLKLNLTENLKPILILFVMILSQNIFNNADKTMLGLLKGNYDVGIYSSAVKITNIVSQLVTSILWVIMPQMSIFFHNRDFFRINELLKKIFSFTVIFGLPSVVGVFMKAHSIIRLIAGNEYMEAVDILKILMLSLLFRFFGGGFIGNTIMLPLKQEKKFMNACIISTCSNVLLNFFFIPTLGAKGAAITTVISELIIMLYLIPKIDKRIKVDYKANTLMGPVIGCLCIMFICWIINKLELNLYVDLGLSIIISIFTYCAVLMLLKNEYMLELKEKFIKVRR